MTTNSIHNAFVNALLADATYVDNLAPGGIPLASDKLQLALEKRLTPELAKYFSEHFDVVTQYLTDDLVGSGFDATVFRSKDDGQVYVSMRGSEGVADFINDADLTLGGLARVQVVDMVNWWLRAVTPVGVLCPQIKITPDLLTLSQKIVAAEPLVGNGSLFGVASSAVVNGHSLGGHLATAFTRLLGGSVPILHTYTYNSANFNPLSDIAFGQIENALNLGKTFYPNSAMQTNFYAKHGVNLTTQNLTMGQIGLRIGLFNENSTTQLPNHYMYKLTDALALADAMNKLDPSLTISKVNSLLEAGSNVTQTSIEGVFNGLNRIINGPSTTKLIGVDESDSDPNRVKFHEELKKLIDGRKFDSLKGKITIQRSDTSLASAAREDFAAFVSLLELSPVSMKANGSANLTTVESVLTASGWSAGDWTADKNLSANDKAAGKQTYTDRWMQDRAAMTGWVAKKNEKDLADGKNLASAAGAQSTKYTDVKTNAVLSIGAVADTQYKQIYFGSDAANTFAGNGKDDALYGGKGDDKLSGLGGNDYLEGNEGDDELSGGLGQDILVGGVGKDKYMIDAGGGQETIIDSDGKGVINVAGIGELSGGSGKTETGFQSTDKKVNYTVVETGVDSAGKKIKDLVITFDKDKAPANAQDSIRIRGWKDGDLQIDLPGNQAVQPTFEGDFKKKLDPDNPDRYLLAPTPTPSSPRQYVADGPEPNALDLMFGTKGDDVILTLGGDDAANGDDGDDTIDGGEGNDFLMGGKGHNVILGGSGKDIIYASAFSGLPYLYAVDTPPKQAPAGAVQIGQGLGWVSYSQNERFTVDDSNFAYDNENLSNRVDAGDGDDRVIGGGGDDIVIGGEGQDRLWGMGGADVIEGGEGDDKILGGGVGYDPNLSNYLDSKDDGADTVSGGQGNDHLFGDAGDDVLSGDAGNDELYGDGGGVIYQETQVDYAGKDLLDGGDGNDTLYGGSYADILRGGQGNDQLSGDKNSLKPGDDELDGGQGDDVLEGDEGSDTLWGGDGTDQVSGGKDNDQIDGGAGNDFLYGDAGNDALQGGGGNDIIQGGDGNDTLLGGAGTDLLQGGMGDDFYSFDSSDTLVDPDSRATDGVDDNQGANTIEYGAASAINVRVVKTTQAPGAVAIVAGEGENILMLANGAAGVKNTIVLGDMNNGGQALKTNELIGRYGEPSGVGGGGVGGGGVGGVFEATNEAGQQFAMAGRGNDVVITTTDKATLSGGRGDDVLNGQGAGNTYLYAAGDGADVIRDGSVIGSTLGVAGASTIELGQGITAADIRLSAERGATGGSAGNSGGSGVQLTGRSLVLNIGGSQPGRIALDGFDFNDAGASLPVATLKFDDGSTAQLPDLLATQGVDTTGTPGNDNVQGIWRAETLTGGAGDDNLIGEAGADTYQWGIGDSRDHIIETGPAGDVDTLQLLGSLSPVDLSFSRAGDDLVVRSRTSLDEVQVRGQFATQAAQGIDRVVFGASGNGQGLVWSRADINANLVALPPLALTQGDDHYTGSAAAESIAALGGNDAVLAGAGDDTVDGGEGDDYVVGDGGNDQLMGGAGNDQVYGVAGDDSLRGGVGNDFLSGGEGNDDLADDQGTNQLDGGTGNDTLTGGTGVDNLSGDDGDDQLNGGANADVLHGEDGQDWLTDNSTEDRLYGGDGDDTLVGGSNAMGEAGSDTYLVRNWPSANRPTHVHELDVQSADLDNNMDKIVLPAGTHLGNVVFRRSIETYTDDLRIVDGTTVDGNRFVNVVGYFSADAQKSGVELIQLGDGRVLDRAAVLAATLGLPVGTAAGDVLTGFRFDDTIDGGAGNDSIRGAAGNDALRGGADNDTLSGDAGDDTLDGGLGNDLLFGGDGNDTIIFGRQSGQDVLGLNRVNAAQNDKVLIDADVTPAELTLYRNGDDLILQIDATGARLVVGDYYTLIDAAGNPIPQWTGDSSGLQTIEFSSDGAVWTHRDIAAKVVLPTSTVTTVNGVDTLNTSQSAALAADIENITGVGTFDVRLVGNTGNNVISGNAANNSLNGWLGLSDPNAWVSWRGDAVLTNSFNSNLIYDGLWKGADTLVGGLGDDTYFVNGGEQMAIAVGGSSQPTVNGDDVVVESAGQGIDTVVTANYSETLTANVEHLIATNQYAYTTGTTTNQVPLPHLYSGNSLDNRIDTSRIFSVTRIDGGAGADTMYGSTRDDRDSTVYVVDNPGDVVIEVPAAVGADSRGDKVEASVSYTLGEAIEDLTLTGADAINGQGNVKANRLLGNAAANVLEGLGGNDTLDGGLGNDTYLFGRGEGVDTILEAAAAADTSAGKSNVLRLKAGIAPAEVVVKQVGNDLEVILGGETEKVTVKGFFSGAAPSSTSPIQRLEFDGGVGWDVAKIQSLLKPNTPPTLQVALPDHALKQGERLNFDLPAGSLVDVDAGDVLTYKLSLADNSAAPSWVGVNATTGALTGNAPVDWVGSVSLKLTATDKSGASASDVFDVVVSSENRAFNGTEGRDVLVGYSGNDTLQGFGDVDRLLGFTGNDQLDGGAGNDELDGGAGNDVYLFGKGDGQDTISELVADTVAGKLNVLRFKGNVVPADLSLKQSGDDLDVVVGSEADKVTIKSFFTGGSSANAANPIQRIEFSSGVSWDLAQIQSRLGANTPPRVGSSPLADQSFKQGEAMTFVIPAGAFVDADPGDAMMYTARSADGSSLPSGLYFDVNTRAFSGWAPTDTVGTSSIKVTATDKSGASVSDVFDLTVAAENRTLVGTSGADQLMGYSGNDTLRGAAGNDQLTGNAGNDALDGGLGDDTYHFNLGDGQDTIHEVVPDASATKINTLSLIAGISTLNTQLNKAGEDLEVLIDNTNDKVLIKSFFSSSGAVSATSPIQKIRVATAQSYTEWNTSHIQAILSMGGKPPVNNVAPTLTAPLATQRLTPNAPFTYTIPASSFADANAGDVLSFKAFGNQSALPAGINFDPATLTFSGMATSRNAVLTLRAMDLAGASVMAGFNLVVDSQSNNLPVLSMPLRDITVAAGAALSFALPLATFTDVDAGDALTYAAYQSGSSVLPTWLTFNASTRTFTGTAPSTAGITNIRVAATDGKNQGDAFDEFDIVIGGGTPPNTAPTLATPLADQTLQPGAAVNYTVPASAFADADAGDVLTYSATLANGAVLPSWLSFNANTRAFSGTAPTASGTTSVKVVATDKAGAAASDVFDLVVNAVTPPANNQLTVRAYASLADNLGPQMEVLVNGVSIGKQEVRASSYQDYTFTASAAIPIGAKVDVVFNNDGGDASGADRNLFVQSITLNGNTVASTAAGVTFDRGADTGAFDGSDVLPGRSELYWNGALRFTTPSAPLPSRITVRAYGSLAMNEGPQMEVLVNGVSIGKQEVRATSHQDYTFTSLATIPAGAKVDVVFNNDGGDANGADRNLFVESITLNGNTVASTAAGVTFDRGADTGAFDGSDVLPGRSELYWNGALRFTAPGAPVPSSITVRAYASLAMNEGPQMEVLVNGVSIGKQEVRATSYQDYTFTSLATIPAGAKVDVVFNNDGGDANGADRNLFVESITVNGHTVASSASGVTFDRGADTLAFDGGDVLPGRSELYWNGALRFTAPALASGQAASNASVGAPSPDRSILPMADTHRARLDATGAGSENKADGAERPGLVPNDHELQTATDAEADWAQLMALMTGERRRLPEHWGGAAGRLMETGAQAETATTSPTEQAQTSALVGTHLARQSNAMTLDGQVHNLLSAMAAFSAPAAGETTLVNNHQINWRGELAVNGSA